jgi:hypothetical protein
MDFNKLLETKSAEARELGAPSVDELALMIARIRQVQSGFQFEQLEDGMATAANLASKYMNRFSKNAESFAIQNTNISVGDFVEIKGISPKYLNGCKLEVTEVDTAKNCVWGTLQTETGKAKTKGSFMGLPIGCVEYLNSGTVAINN